MFVSPTLRHPRCAVLFASLASLAGLLGGSRAACSYTAEKLVPTPAEQKVIDAAAKGGVAEFRSGDKSADDPTEGANWGDNRTVRAEIIYALAVGTNASWSVNPRGAQIKGAKTTGQLDFDSAKLTRPLFLWDCYVEQEAFFRDASAALVGFDGSYLNGGLNGDGLEVDHDLFMRNGFHAKGEVLLVGARIGGEIDCSNGRFENPGGYALNANGAKLDGGIFLRNVHALAK